ncbi:MAG: lytic transglycosylase domain-containing protein [Roseovarius sp.]
MPAPAESPPPYPDFTFKMSKPPKPGTKKRINVQIEPGDQVVAKPAKPKAHDTETGTQSAAVAASGRYDWFWTKVSPGLSENPATRLRSAFASLEDGPGGVTVTGPRLQALQGIASAQGANILRATIGTEVSPALVLAVIAVESGGRSAAESHKGAQGLMQLMPDTATRFGVTDSLSSDQNIKGGVAYLDWLLKEFGGDAVLALAGYNAGENAVKKHGGVPPYSETRDYVPKVLAAFQVAGGLCKTRPELITDACALNLAVK